MEKIDIPDEKLAEFYQVVADTTYWNEAELTPRQIKHIVDCLAPQIAQWAAGKGWTRGFDDGEADVFDHDTHPQGWDSPCLKNPYTDEESANTL